MSTDVQHSPIGASSCERWWNCPGSFWLSQQAPPQETTFYAAEGTVAHGIGEFYLRAGIPVDGQFLGDEIEQEGHVITVDEEMLDAVSLYVNCINDEVQRYGLLPHQLRVEQHFTLSHIDKEAFGTSDATLHVPYHRLIVGDYKHGAGIAVSVKLNKQTLYYGLGALMELPEDERAEIKELETIIIQPRAAHLDGPIRRAVYPVEWVMREWQADLFAAVRRVRSGMQYFEAGPHCKFCPALAICPEARNSVGIAAAMDFAEVPGEALCDLYQLTPEQISNLLLHGEFIENWVKAVYNYARNIAECNIDVPGFKLVNRKTQRKWVDPAAVIEELEWLFGEDLYKPVKKTIQTPNQVEALIKRHKMDVDIAHLWQRPDKGKTLARAEDARQVALSRAADDFAGIDLDNL